MAGERVKEMVESLKVRKETLAERVSEEAQEIVLQSIEDFYQEPYKEPMAFGEYEVIGGWDISGVESHVRQAIEREMDNYMEGTYTEAEEKEMRECSEYDILVEDLMEHLEVRGLAVQVCLDIEERKRDYERH